MNYSSEKQRINFNLMEAIAQNGQKQDQFLCLKQFGQIGNYTLARNHTSFQSSNFSNIPQQHQSIDIQKFQKITTDSLKISNFKHGIFKFQFYREPLNDILTIFIPLWLLSLINLAIFFEENLLSTRVACLATLMVAYTAFFPTIRGRLPPTSKITIMDIIISAIVFSSLLFLIKSFLSNQNHIDTQIWKNDSLLLIGFGIFIGTIIVITIFVILHQIKIACMYDKRMQTLKCFDFSIKKWTNKRCQQLFEQFQRTNNITFQSLQGMSTAIQKKK